MFREKQRLELGKREIIITIAKGNSFSDLNRVAKSLKPTDTKRMESARNQYFYLIFFYHYGIDKG